MGFGLLVFLIIVIFLPVNVWLASRRALFCYRELKTLNNKLQKEQ